MNEVVITGGEGDLAQAIGSALHEESVRLPGRKELDVSCWDEVMAVNLGGAYFCARKAALKMVKQRSGHIIFIGSYSGFFPHIGQASYAAAKSGLIGLTKSLAKELGTRGVRVNMIVPGWLETKMTSQVAEEKKYQARKEHSLGEFNTPEKVATFVKILHNELTFTSGQIFHLDSRIIP